MAASFAYLDKHPKAQIRLLLLIAAGTVTLFLVWEGRIADHLFWDEGWLWHGVQRVMVGEIPMRDFGAYDPARYYWSAGLMTILRNNGVVANRFAASLFQFIGLFLGLLIATPIHGRANILRISISSFIICLWMYPQYKVFDSAIAVALMCSFSHLCARPTRGRILFAGIAVGVAACFGKNHGLYGGIGGLLILCYLIGTGAVRGLLTSVFSWSVGVILGYLPMIFLLTYVPELGHQFLVGIRLLFEVKTTNLSLSIPWPWLADSQHSIHNGIRDFVVGLFFLAVIVYAVFGPLMVGYAVLRKKQLSPVMIASSALALPYAHYAVSRADVYHLALGIFPLLLGSLAYLNRSPNALNAYGLGSLFVATMLSIFPHHPGWKASLAGNWSAVRVGDDTMLVDPETAFAVKVVGDLIEKHAPHGRPFLVTPFWPGSYPAFGRKSPMLDDYALFYRTAEFQRAEIERIKKSDPGFILIYDYALDGRNDRRFSYTHAIVDQFIRHTYQPADNDHLTDKLFRLYVNRKEQVQDKSPILASSDFMLSNSSLD